MSNFTASPTITVTDYATNPDVVAQTTAGGRWSITNPDATLSVFVSFDGSTTAIEVPPGVTRFVQSQQFSGLLWLRLSDTGTVTPTCVLELSASLGYAWNNTDTTQLAGSQALPLPASGSTGFTNPALTLTAAGTLPGGFSLRFTADAAAANAFAIYWFDALVPLSGTFHAGVLPATPGTPGEGLVGGVAVMGDATAKTAMAFGLGFGAADAPILRVKRFNGLTAADTIDTVSAGATAADALGTVDVRLVSTKDIGTADPGMTSNVYVSTWGGGFVQRAYPAILLAAFSSDWAPAANNRFGLFVGAVSGSANPVTIDFFDISVTGL